MTRADFEAMTIKQLASEIIEWGETFPSRLTHAEITIAIDVMCEKSAKKWNR